MTSMHGACHASYMVSVIHLYFISYTYFYFYTHHTPCLVPLLKLYPIAAVAEQVAGFGLGQV